MTKKNPNTSCHEAIIDVIFFLEKEEKNEKHSSFIQCVPNVQMKLFEKIIFTIFVIGTFSVIGAFRCTAPNGLYANSKDSKCRTFIQCSGRIPFLKSCPKYLIYDPRKSVCVWKYVYKCPGTKSSKHLYFDF